MKKTLPNRDSSLTISQAAQKLKVSVMTLRRWERSGKLISEKTSGNHRRYSLKQITEFRKKPKKAIQTTRVPLLVSIPVQVPIKISDSKPQAPLPDAPILYSRIHLDQKKVLFVATYLFFLMLFVSGSVKAAKLFGFFHDPKSNILGKTQASQVLQATTTVPSFSVAIESIFKENSLFEKDVEIVGNLTLGGDLVTAGALTIPSLVTTAGTTVGADLAVNGGDLTTTQTTFNLLAGATTLGIGGATGTTTINNNLAVTGTTTLAGLTAGATTTGALTASSITDSGALTVSGTSTLGTVNAGDITISAGDVLNIGGSGSTGAYNIIGDSISGASGSMDSDDDLYIEGNLEVDGTIIGSLSSVTLSGISEGSILFAGAGGVISGDDTNFFWNDTTNRLGIGVATPTRDLDVAGDVLLGNATTDLITFTGRMTSGTSLIPAVDLGSDLGAVSLRFNNIYAANLTLDSGFTSSGQLLVTYNPTATTFAESSLRINVTTPAANEQMLGIGSAGFQRALIDAEGDLVIGYNNAASAPTTDAPLTLYNHGSSIVSTINTSGNLRLGSAAVTADTGFLNVTGAFTGKALAIFNETGDQDIIAASASGTPVFTVARTGDITIGNSATTPDVDVNLYGDIFQQGNSDLTAITGIVDTFVYDTTKDSDGGAWTGSLGTPTSGQLSWYTEAKDDGAADPCVVSTDDRCGRSAFPKKSIIVADASNVYIFDALDNSLWMKFTQNASGYQIGVDSNNNPTSVYALNGSIYIGMAGSSTVGLVEIDFKGDRSFTYDATDRSQGNTSIANRNSATTYSTDNNTSLALSNATINDVHAATVGGNTLVAAGTDNGMNLIDRNANQVRVYSAIEGDDYNSIWLTKEGSLYGLNETSAELNRYQNTHKDTGSRRYVTPDRLWGLYGKPSLTASAPTISTAAPQALYISPKSSTQNANSDSIYVGTNLGLSAVNDGAGGTGNVGTFTTTNQAQLPDAVRGFGATASINISSIPYIYYLGGSSNGGATIFSTVYKATISSSGNIGTLSTTSQAQLPQANYNFASALARISDTNYIYLIGGENPNNAELSTVYKASINGSGDFQTFATTNQAQLPVITDAPSAEVVQVGSTVYLYVIGGGGNDGAGLSTVYRASINSSGDVQTFATTNQAQLLEIKQNHGTATANIGGKKYLYVIGGSNNTTTLYKANIDDSGNVGTFSTVSQGQLPAARNYNQPLIANISGQNYLYVIGGHDGANPFSTVYRATIDPSGNIGIFSTVSQGQLGTNLSHFGPDAGKIINIGGSQNIYTFAGWNGSAYTTLIYRAQIDSESGSVKNFTQTGTTEEMIGDVRGMWGFTESSGSLSDSSFRANFLEDENAPTYSVRGVRNTGLTFDGSADHLCSDADNNGACDNDPDFDFGTGSFSVSTWFNHAAAISGTDTIVDHYYNTTPSAIAGWQVYMNSSGQLVFAIDDDSTLGPDDSAVAANDLSDGQWHHLTAVKNGTSSISLYVDGEKVAEDLSLTATGTMTGTAVLMGVGSDCSVGAACATGANFWDGSLDELMITAEALSPTQIKNLYLSGKGALKYRTVSSTATAGSTTTVTDGTASWVINEFVGAFVEMTSGSASGQSRRIVSNTGTVLTVAPAFGASVANTDTFIIHPHELYGGTNTVTAISGTPSVPGEAEYLYVGTNDDNNGGGVTKIRRDTDYVTDLWHGGAGKTDDSSAAWNTTANYDDITSVSYNSDTLSIAAQDQFWTEYQPKSLTEKIDSLTNKTNTLSLAGQYSLTDGHRQDDTTNSQVGYQVVRKGWGYIPNVAGATTSEIVNYGITFNDIPIVVANDAGFVTAFDPPNLSSCNASSTNIYDIAANAITPTGFIFIFWPV